MLDLALAYSNARREENLAALSEFLRIPSVSTLPEHAPDMQRAAQWMAAAMRAAGLTGIEIVPTAGHPLVYGEWLEAGPDAPTLLAYGHYDVQPVDPIDEWRTPPFEPTVSGENLFARGSSDDKGQAFLVLAAAAAYLQTSGRLPINFKFMVEGEEEISSPSIPAYIAEWQERLACDAVLICDSGMLDPQTPLIVYGTRGLTYMEVIVRGPAVDLHSGTFGGAVDNPFNVLTRLLAQLQDGETRQIRIPGFYDRVQALDDEEHTLLAQIPLGDQVIQHLTGVRAAAGEAGYTSVERASTRPTLDIHGVPGGFTAPGKKTVIPARAAAKVSMRLVPNQDPQEIAELFSRYLHSLAPTTVTVEVNTLGLAKPSMVDFRDPAIQAAAQAFQRGFGAQPLYMRMGGTLPIVTDFQDSLGVPVVMMGFGLPDDNLHAPNEKFHLPNFYRGIDTVIHYFSLLGAA